MCDRKLTLDFAGKTKKLTLLKKAKKLQRKLTPEIQFTAGGLVYNRRGYVYEGPRVSVTNITTGGSIRTARGNLCVTYMWVPPLAGSASSLPRIPQIDKSHLARRKPAPSPAAVACRRRLFRRRSPLRSLPLSPLALAPSSPRPRSRADAVPRALTLTGLRISQTPPSTAWIGGARGRRGLRGGARGPLHLADAVDRPRPRRVTRYGNPVFAREPELVLWHVCPAAV